MAAFDQPYVYEIKVKGQLSSHWLKAFSSLSPQTERQPDGSSIILFCGTFLDGGGLFLTLQSLYNLGCVLVSVKRCEPNR